MKFRLKFVPRMLTVFFALLLASLLFSKKLQRPIQAADILFTQHEVFLTNQTENAVTVSVDPTGMIFDDRKAYGLVATGFIEGTDNQPITGDQVNIAAGANGAGVVNHARTSLPSPRPTRHICYGRYRMTVEGVQFYIDFLDSDYPDAYGGTVGGGLLSSDLFFAVDASERVLWATQSYPSGNVVQLHGGEIIKIWDQRPVGGGYKTQNKNGFKINAGTNIPLNGSDEVVTHFDPGRLYVNLDILANTTVLSSKSFIIQETGTQLTFSNNTQLTINGTLTAEDATFIAASGATWQGIAFASGSGGTLQNCTLDAIGGGAIAAIQIDNAAPTIASSTIATGGGIGISVSGASSAPAIHHNTITPASYGLRFYDAGSTVYNNQISQTNHQSTAVIASVLHSWAFNSQNIAKRFDLHF